MQNVKTCFCLHIFSCTNCQITLMGHTLRHSCFLEFSFINLPVLVFVPIPIVSQGSMFLNVIIILFTTMICFPTHSDIECTYVMHASHMSPSHGGLLAYYHMVAIFLSRFLPGNRRLGSELDNQKESIGSIFKSQALNLSLNDFSR